MDDQSSPWVDKLENPHPKPITIDWRKVEAVSEVKFESDIREAIESELNWHSQPSAEYAPDVDTVAYQKAIEALAAIVRAPSAKDRMQPIEYELERVFWFLEIMAQPLDSESRKINADYFLYSQIWTIIGRTGIRLTRGKGLPDNKLSKAQQVFQEICAQAGIQFSNSDQALAQALNRALKVTNPNWDK